MSPELHPLDEHNEALLANVHPPGWKNPEPAARYNLVVLGAGTAGLVTAAGAAGLGARVALVEQSLMGGDCLNVGCVPSKSLLRSAHVAGEVRDAASYGVRVPSGTRVDFAAVMERMRAVRRRISTNDSAHRFSDELGVDVFLGRGRFTGADEIDVEGATLRFKKAVIATGGRAVVPPIEGLREAGFLTNETVFNLTELPRRLLVLGGGPIGCELSQAFRRFGSEVTMVEMGPQFLSREDPDAARILYDAFVTDGIDVRLDTQLVRVELRDGERLCILERGGESESVPVDTIVVGAGRAPNVEDLGLENVGVETSRFGIQVDDHLRTTNRRIFAAGDVCMETRFTHAADFAARAVIQNALFFGRKKLSALTIPWCTYTHPEIAHVGMYERDAATRGIEIDTFTRELRDVDRAIAEGDDVGFVKIHVKKGGDQILGATIVARHAGEMISEVSVAMAGGVGLSKLSAVIHPYPTQAEAIRQVGDAYNRTRLTPRVKRLFALFLRWSR
ncbi:MAG: mercuric reductase [Proteobacteria bacterium]|nr:mercuric reductase [Pseudomonadota bacterium]MCZ6782776.1 mercuric reductase [Pseudomonadota bacterium]